MKRFIDYALLGNIKRNLYWFGFSFLNVDGQVRALGYLSPIGYEKLAA